MWFCSDMLLEWVIGGLIWRIAWVSALNLAVLLEV
jgi:hypothetical protein